MPFTFAWNDETKTAMRYRAEGDWNWKDYHTCVRASLFSLHGNEEQVDSIIDLTGSTRASLPSGLAPHVRTFGKKGHPNLTGRAVVIGMPDEGLQALQVGDERSLATSDGFIRFIDTEAGLPDVLAQWRQSADTE